MISKRCRQPTEGRNRRIPVVTVMPTLPVAATVAAHVIRNIFADPIARISDDRAEAMPPRMRRSLAGIGDPDLTPYPAGNPLGPVTAPTTKHIGLYTGEERLMLRQPGDVVEEALGDQG